MHRIDPARGTDVENDRARRNGSVLLAIGVFKLVKAALLVALAAGALKFANPDAADVLRHWARASAVVASHELIRRLLAAALAAS